MRAVSVMIFLTVFQLSAILLAQQPDVRLDPRVSRLPTDKLGPFVHTSDGNVLALDNEATFVSDDGGKTWSDPRPLTGAADRNIRVSNERAMLRTNDGTIVAAFMNLNERHWTWNDELHDAPGAMLPTWVMRSEDDGKTWSHVQKLHDDWSGAVRDMIQTADGRIIFTAMKMQHDPGRHAVLTYSSTDDGRSWKASNLIDLGGRGHHGGVTEPTLTELPDGRLWMLIRTNWGEFWSAFSRDGGRFWSVLEPSGIAASSAPGLLKRLDSGRLLLVWNRPFPDGATTWELSGGDGLWSETPVSNHREELSLALSDDDGATWTDPVVIAKTIHAAPKNRWLAYPYVFEYRPGELWLTTMQGNVRVQLHERDFINDRGDEVSMIESLPCRISEPGLYKLANDLSFDASRGAAVMIESDDVTLDLDGNTLSGTGDSETQAIGVQATDRSSIRIQNGRITGFYFGIDLRVSSDGSSQRHLVSDVTLAHNRYFGVRVMGSDCEIRRCAISDIGGSTLERHTIPHGARLVGQRNAMRDSRIIDLRLKRFDAGKGEIVGVHFDAAKDSVFERNTVIELTNDADDTFSVDDDRERRFGMWINGGPKKDTFVDVRDNTFVGFTVPIAFAPGSDGHVTGNTFHGADDRPIRGKPESQLPENTSIGADEP